MSFEDMAHDVARYVDENEIGRSVVIGFSMGAKTGMLYALLYPDKVKHLIILDNAPIDYAEHYPWYVKLMERFHKNAFKIQTQSKDKESAHKKIDSYK